MRNLRAGIFAFLIGLGGGWATLLPTSAIASGIPVVDIASITQQIIQYTQNLTDYSNQINQLATQGQQFTQQLTEYSQMLNEYNSYLNQVKSIKSSISSGDWNKLMNLTAGFYGLSDIATISTMDPSSPSFLSDINVILGNYGHVPRASSSVSSDLSTAGFSTADAGVVEGRYEVVNKRYERYQDLQRVVATNQGGSVQRQAKIQDLGVRLRSLGNESDLQTAQLIATQGQLQMDQSEASLHVLNQILQQQGIVSATEASREAEIIDKEVMRLQAVSPGTAPLLGRSTWGSF